VSAASPAVLADGFTAPSPRDFELPGRVRIGDLFGEKHQYLISKPTVLLVLAALIVFVGFLVTARRTAVVPGKLAFAGEQAYGFVRNSLARDIIGSRDFMAYVPYLVALFYFVLVNNLFGIIPIIQFPTFAHVGFAYGLALMSWILYNAVGIRKHGVGGYLKMQTIPPGVSKVILPLLIPLEFLSNIIVRPITLSLRLFANMFAGHLLLILFTLGGQYLLIDAGKVLYKPVGVLALIMAVAVSFLEILVQVLQAYVFALLTAMYISGALAESH
jgi:F-type H+-transporting ATPase subunit a